MLNDDLRRFGEALVCFDQASQYEPNLADADINRGNALKDLKRLEEAIASLDDTLGIDPDEALASFEHAFAINPEYAEAHNNRGNTPRDLQHLHAALESYDRAIQLKPDLAEAHCNRGALLEKMGQHEAALESLTKAITLQPDGADAYSHLATVHFSRGDMQSGIGFIRKALSLDPRMVNTHSALIFELDLLAGPDTAAQQQERGHWNQLHAEPLMKARDYVNDPDPQRPLRIGYVSGDFNDHSAASSFLLLLASFDRSLFEVIAYSNSSTKDEITASIQSRVTLWRDIYELSDDAAADLILHDRVDLLVDLSGHTKGNRLLVFARKPAPVQVSAIGYPTGTGMQAMDALFSDAVVIPPEERELYAEDVRYLPSVIMYSRNPDDFPPVNELPALSSNVITFGAFNRLAKITEESLIVWVRLLQTLPQSALILKAGEFDDQVVRTQLMAPFIKAGIAPERISILGKTPWAGHMHALNRVDIALDTLPHGGGITTLEGIMMGIPVVTLRWPTFAGRASASLLTSLGLTDWIAENPDQYMEIAIEKSRDLDSLAALRARLRPQFAASIFGNPAVMVKAIENEYRKLWQEWCARRSLPAIKTHE